MSSVNLREATKEISRYVGSKSGRRTIRTRTYLVLYFYRFTRQGWLLAKHHAYPILQKYSYWNIRSLSGVVYHSITYYDPVSDVTCKAWGWNSVCFVRSTFRYQSTSLFESDNHDLVILSRWLQHYREPVLNPCVIIISICLK